MTTPESAVQRCANAYYKAGDIEDARNDHSPESLQRVNNAYRHAMPYLLPDRDSIDAFIACVTHGLVIQVFQPAEASKLLYAAQVAVTSLRARNQPAKSQPESQPNSQPDSQGAPSKLCLGGNDLSQTPSMETASSSPCVGDHQPQPTASHPPTPSPMKVGGAELAAPQVPPTHLPKPRNQVEELLERLYAGKLPAGTPLTPCAAVLKAVPPTPSPLRQVPTGENTLLRVAS
jgi:hypothetical protein